MKIGIFTLNKNEQRVVVLVVLALLAGAFFRYWRAVNAKDRAEQPNKTETIATPAPSPEEDDSRDQD